MISRFKQNLRLWRLLWQNRWRIIHAVVQEAYWILTEEALIEMTLTELLGDLEVDS